MFPNPLEELHRQASQGCVLALGVMVLPIFLVFLFIFVGWLAVKVWPLLVLAALLWIVYRLIRRGKVQPARPRTA